MDASYFRDLYRYTFWADRKVWTCVEQLSDEQFNRDLEYSVGSLHNQCVHTMGVEWWWVCFLATGELQFLDRDSFVTRGEIREWWDETERFVLNYINSLTAEELEREVRPDFWDDEDAPICVWQALIQVANHSTDHRAQMLAGIHRLGGPTVGQDFLDYLGER